MITIINSELHPDNTNLIVDFVDGDDTKISNFKETEVDTRDLFAWMVDECPSEWTGEDIWDVMEHHPEDYLPRYIESHKHLLNIQ